MSTAAYDTATYDTAPRAAAPREDALRGAAQLHTGQDRGSHGSVQDRDSHGAGHDRDSHSSSHDRSSHGSGPGDFAPRIYRGRTVDELIPTIVAELGEDAVVIRHHRGLTGGFAGFFQRPFVEIEASLPTEFPT